VIAVGYAMRTFRPARELYAIGSNPDAAALAGIPSARRVFVAFVTSGALAGLGGALFLALFAQVDNSAGLGYELNVVAAVVVGGVAIFGGSGTVVGAALGALLLNTIQQGLVAVRSSSFWDEAIAGGLLLVAISIDRLLALRVARSLRSAEGAHREL
jgi:rhamnose transport system permease protein